MFANMQLMSRDQLLNGAAVTKPVYNEGQTVMDENGNVYEYVKTKDNETIVQYDALLLLKAGAEQLDVDNAASGTGSGAPIGIAMVAITGVASTAYYLWVLVKTGPGQTAPGLRVANSCDDYVGLQATSTDGVVDDASAVGDIVGMVITTEQGSPAGINTTAILNYPRILETFT